MARLGDYIEQIRGVSYKPDDICNPSDSDAVAILRANNIQDDGLNFDDLVYVKKSKVSDKQYIQQGDIVVCASSGSKSLVGKAAIATENCSISFGAFCKVVRPKKLIPSYLGYFFQSPKYRSTISELSSGANINNIRNEHIDELDILIVSEEKQENIANKLDALSNLISLRKQQLSKLDELVKARFVEMFGDLVFGDKYSDNKCKIGNIASVTKLAGFEFTKYIQYKEEGDIIMLRGLNCKKGHLILDDIKWIDKETSDLLPRSKLYYGDILMTYAGTIGDVAMVDSDNKYHLAPNVAKITLHDKEKCNPLFLIHLFMYSHDYIMTFASQVAQASINMEKIRSFEYFFPPVQLQNEFTDFVKQIDKSKVEVRQSLEKLETLKKSLMQQYFG